MGGAFGGGSGDQVQDFVQCGEIAWVTFSREILIVHWLEKARLRHVSVHERCPDDDELSVCTPQAAHFVVNGSVELKMTMRWKPSRWRDRVQLDEVVSR